MLLGLHSRATSPDWKKKHIRAHTTAKITVTDSFIQTVHFKWLFIQKCLLLSH